VNEMSTLLPAEQMMSTGLIDYALGAAPHTGAFVIAHEGHPRKRKELSYYKMGDGPFYVFYTPYHLPHIQICSTIGRAALFQDATVTPLGAPVCQVAAMAKRDIKAGEVLDGVGGFSMYGVIDNSSVFRKDGLLPMGLAEGCKTRRAIPKDAPLFLDDVEIPSGRLCDQLWREQEARFFG
jgi:predicted homoserine dehydrogenase-like protein